METDPGAPPGPDPERVAELMAQHGAARYADAETIAACLPRPPADEPATGSARS